MIKAIVSDFSRVILFPKDTSYQGSLNGLHKSLSSQENYNPLDHFRLNSELLKYYKSLTNAVDLYLFTSDVIQDAPAFQSGLQSVFRKTYSASKMEIDKNDPRAYRQLINDLHLLPEEILYVDDNSENIEAAVATGLTTIQYQDNQDVILKIQKVISS